MIGLLLDLFVYMTETIIYNTIKKSKKPKKKINKTEYNKLKK